MEQAVHRQSRPVPVGCGLGPDELWSSKAPSQEVHVGVTQVRHFHLNLLQEREPFRA